MTAWILGNLVSIAAALVIAAIVGFAVAHLVVKHKKGGCGCGCGCGNCASDSDCTCNDK